MAVAFRVPVVVAITGIVVALIGVVLAAGGGWLLALGGSAYYALAGLALLVTGVLLLRGHRAALLLYAVVLVGTLGWAVWESGLDFWALAPRGDVLVPVGVWLLLPFVAGRLRPGSRAPSLALAGAVLLSVVVLGVSLTRTVHDVDGTLPIDAAAAPPPAELAAMPDSDWRAYGRGNAGDRFSPLTQITPANVHDLKVAWTFHVNEQRGPNDPSETTMEVTPLKANHMIYLCSPHQVVFALDAATGKQNWRFDPHLRDNPTFQHLTCRGVSYHETRPAAVTAAGAPAPADCPRRIVFGTNDADLFALDADTGAPCESFGEHGRVNLNEGMPNTTLGFYEITSPPVVTDKVIVIGGSVIDNYSEKEPSGVIRGFDVYSGKLIWAWDSGAEDENALPSPTHTYSANSPNSWTVSAADEALGLVYVPLGTSTPDIWGGDRSALNERYDSALVALDIATGKLRWSYQNAHHDLWDMDFPSQPSLVDVTTATGVVPAVYIPAKTGNIFVLDRRTGTPIVPAPERPVPQGPAPGDRLSPTQPFSDLSFRPRENIREAQLWGATMFDQLACRIIFRGLRYEGPFTPPSVQGTLVFPGDFGMFEWGGIAVDPLHQIAIANPMAIPFISRLIPRGPDNPDHPTDKRPAGSETGVQPMYGAPFGITLDAFFSPIGLPCLQPPWGYMAGLDLKTNRIVWQHPVGTIRDSAPVPVPLKIGVPMLGGPMMTAGGVAFETGTLDYYIRAFDVRTGAMLWQDRLPAGGQSTPMTYAEGGRQFVVTADGGHGSFGTKLGDSIVAYALPQ